MNIKLRKLIIVIFTFIFSIFLLNIFVKEFKSNESDIINMNILNYIPNDYQFTILSNSTNNDIKQYIDQNISLKKQDELNIVKDSIISYLGFDLQGKIKDLYDNEFAITYVSNKLNKNDILIIFKLKKNKDINSIINIGEEFNKSNQIIELKRLGKLNYISHIFQTKDNYIIASSNKQLIDKSLHANNNINKILSRNLIPKNININEIKFISISKNLYPKYISDSELNPINELITIINSADNKIKIRSFSSNINTINTKIPENQIDNIKNIILTNKYSPYKQSINFLFADIEQKELIKEISQKVKDQILFITNENNWVLYFKNKLPNEITIDQFNFLKKYIKEDLNFNNQNYSIYSNDKLEIKDNDIIYDKKNPIFSLEDGDNTFIGNNLNSLLNISKNFSLYNQYLYNSSEMKSFKYILNDIFFIKNITNKQLTKNSKFFRNLQYFINTELFLLEDICINISHILPEQYETIYLESNLKIL